MLLDVSRLYSFLITPDLKCVVRQHQALVTLHALLSFITLNCAVAKLLWIIVSAKCINVKYKYKYKWIFIINELTSVRLNY